MTMKIVTSQADLTDLQAELGIRFDWHEPDNQGVTIQFQGGGFDNAMCVPDKGEAGIVVLLYGEPVAYVNLALLFAFAGGKYAGI